MASNPLESFMRQVWHPPPLSPNARPVSSLPMPWADPDMVGDVPWSSAESGIRRMFTEAQDEAKKAWDSLFTKSEQKQIANKSLEAVRNPQQLEMFTPAERLRAIVPGDADAARRAGLLRADEQVWETKLRESKQRPLYDDIAKSGVREPVWIGHPPGATGPPQIIEGHHRTASAFDINPKSEVPVMHHERNWLRASSPKLSEVKRFAPNQKIAKQLLDFSIKWGRQALYAMLKAPK
jgi:hypothetical protein